MQRLVLTTYVLISLCLVIVFIGWNFCVSKNLNAQNKIDATSQMIEQELLSFFRETEEMMAVIGKEMAKSHPNDLIPIWQRLSDAFADLETVKKSFRWPDFAWINIDLQQIVNTKYGLLASPLDMSIRDYTRYASKKPLKLLFAKKGASIPHDRSNGMIIPIGMGIVNERKEFLGIVAAGIYLSNLTRKIEHLIHDRSTHYVLLDQEGDVVLETNETKLEESPKLLKELRSIQQDSAPLTMNGKQVPQSPFLSLTAQKKNISTPSNVLILFIIKPLSIYAIGIE